MHIPEEIGSKYRLIVLAGERVRQLQKGASPRIENPDGQKLTQIAVKELLKSKVNFHSKDAENDPDSSDTNQELVGV